jgi:hypothetical protein
VFRDISVELLVFLLPRLSLCYFNYRYMDWVFSKYAGERNDEVRLLLMKAMAETLRLEGDMPKLKDFSAVSVFFNKFVLFLV